MAVSRVPQSVCPFWERLAITATLSLLVAAAVGAQGDTTVFFFFFFLMCAFRRAVVLLSGGVGCGGLSTQGFCVHVAVECAAVARWGNGGLPPSHRARILMTQFWIAVCDRRNLKGNFCSKNREGNIGNRLPPFLPSRFTFRPPGCVLRLPNSD